MCRAQKDHNFEKMINYMVNNQMGLGGRFDKYFVSFRHQDGWRGVKASPVVEIINIRAVLCCPVPIDGGKQGMFNKDKTEKQLL